MAAVHHSGMTFGCRAVCLGACQQASGFGTGQAGTWPEGLHPTNCRAAAAAAASSRQPVQMG